MTPRSRNYDLRALSDRATIAGRFHDFLPTNAKGGRACEGPGPLLSALTRPGDSTR
jgi:hypothetical protein